MARSQPIAAEKFTFLTRQIRALSAPLSVPSSAHTTLPSVSDKTLADVLVRSNEKIKHHNRSVFSAQATRHIAEQIETLYWNEVRVELEVSGQASGETVVKRDLDLGTDKGVRALGEKWADVLAEETEEHEEGHVEEDEQRAKRYEDKRVQLLELCKKRDETERRLERYRRLRALLQPYEQPQEHIQPNLVTKDGELGKELERMRVLLARVTARMGEHKDLQGQSVAASADQESTVGFEEKLATIMDMK
ncbi:uncharacterized protein HMPREF1541_07379 [Cyphellophora europaea CBS 101466]|uniref:Kinetochore protein fta4 n=1 Tax=Cyphellophora europaea (strain CBS 101466) TaxID=1220924 RepID=W2RML6_CYPE1|nr:uncharacterized protein HMPREF1541_07379 [Cyphellophora europaea CBS 101466]ETN37756.1 hypothetical protein HMPREF1541_07379 [Cyphellophora europaea CBS 101466]